MKPFSPVMLVSGLSQVNRKEWGLMWLNCKLLTEGKGHNSESLTVSK